MDSLKNNSPSPNIEQPHPSQQEQPHPSLSQTSPHPSPLPRGEGIEGREIIYCQKEYNPKYIVELSKELRQQQTEAEEILWEVLRNRKLNNLKFRRQHPFGRYIADFYCDELRIVIELD
ncbi:MAG: DUF559 domain-containing protein [bacterium]|nr:DUF559 domain-containing protein [bacterium]